MRPFQYNDYEAVCAAMAMVEAAHGILEESEICEDECESLFSIQNTLNKKRLALLGNGTDRPWHVSDLLAGQEA